MLDNHAECSELENGADLPMPSRTGHSSRKTTGRSGASHDDAECVLRQLAKVREYLDAALQDPDPEQAMLGIANAALVKLAVRLQAAIDDVLDSAATDPAGLESAALGVDQLLRVIGMSRGLMHLKLAMSAAQQALRHVQHGGQAAHQRLLRGEEMEN